MNELRILAMGDNHGNVSSLERVVEDTEDEEFDYVIHVGDLTNFCFDGDAAQQQLADVAEQFKSLQTRGNLVFIYGNRDYESGFVGIGPRIDRHTGIELPGTELPPSGTIEIGGQAFTQNPDDVTRETILVTHYQLSELFDHFNGLGYFSGHSHSGRLLDRSLNTAFLHRDESHGSEPLDGGYFEVELSKDKMDVTMHSLGGLSRVQCPDHATRGIQYNPANWKTDCKFCHDEDSFYEEITASAKHSLKQQNDPVTEDRVIEMAIDLVAEDGIPTNFENRLVEFVEGSE